jgi:glycosyltransferase involved in cell wall biosynthesis
LRVALMGNPPRQWASLNRTYRAYSTALGLLGSQVSGDGRTRGDAMPDAVIGFWGVDAWATPLPRSIPRLICLHGGGVIDFPRLRPLLATLRENDWIICNCHADISVLESLRAPGGPQLAVLPLPVADSLERMDRGAARRMLALSEDALVLAFVARLTPHKGLHHFLRALRHCRETISPRVCGLVVGDFWPDYTHMSPLAPRYRGYIAGLLSALELRDAVHFVPTNSDDAFLSAVYSAPDLLVHPTTSPDENFGYAPLEALKCGLPVVTTAYGGLKDSVGLLEYGASVPTWTTATGVRFDLFALVARSARLLADAGARTAASEEGAEVVKAHYGTANFVDRLGALLRSAVGGARASAAGEAPHRARGAVLEESATPDDLAHAWAQMRPAIDQYVSTSCDDIPPGAVLYSWPGTTDARSKSYLVQDPSWPMTALLRSHDFELLEHLPLDVGGLPRPFRPAWREDPGVARSFRRLCEAGVLAWTGEKIAS